MPKDAPTHRPIQFSNSRNFRLDELKIAMKYTDCEFDRFRKSVWASAKSLEIKPSCRHDQVNPDVWDGLMCKVKLLIPQHNLHVFPNINCIHWPIAIYFDRWNMSRGLRDRGRPRKEPTSGHEIPPVARNQTTQYVGKRPPPQKSISFDLLPTKPPSPKFKPSLHLSNGPYDNADPQPCPVCRSAPVLTSEHLNALFKDDHEALSGLYSIGVQTDLELNMLLMLNKLDWLELIRDSSLSPVKKVSVKNKLQTFQPVVHVKPDVSRMEIHQYLAKLYPCPHHRQQNVLSYVPSTLLKLFNQKHIENLIPIALLLGMKTDSEYIDIVFNFHEADWDEMLSKDQMLLSPLEKAVLKSAFKTARYDD
ncbi:hypothetical protein BDP27DRAFT_1430697 [Rhodocollybia butyracea]|uniref:Uncharacterized protein n=1 Tax=Rhodocollybia butyracea TaxID=206335 RepID=A0A9P5TZ64_9AGAR|nr:hypothetical protein BDP27DRAFT_1430697 [Rhodocollybia butyracea]